MWGQHCIHKDFKKCGGPTVCLTYFATHASYIAESLMHPASSLTLEMSYVYAFMCGYIYMYKHFFGANAYLF